MYTTNKREWKNKRRLDATARSQSASNFTANASRNKCSVVRHVIAIAVAITLATNNNTKKRSSML